MDDFTIILPELTAITCCDLKEHDGLDGLWRMVERYKMTAPITITVRNKAFAELVIKISAVQAAH
jgi:hypothetical protein